VSAGDSYSQTYLSEVAEIAGSIDPCDEEMAGGPSSS
jgi:hypothetical protein